ncbi:nucleotidyl transferase AbiEii/AbiGii toxin family protein [Bifidobacterium mongoliense]|uniref:nucleotidyl transferase AbiEii/AbiGii toxin family protein n=1 Tax=Bifidobacterium mongoliense TaxID=518643 RepID=UPI0030ECADC7
MNHDVSYGSPTAVEQAIKAAAYQAFREDPSTSVDERIRLEYFRRFLSRVFSQAGNQEWVLKGGTSMLARIPSARATMDIDLFNAEQSLDNALKKLRTLASIDLSDFFRFEYMGCTKTLKGSNNEYTNGYRVKFDVYIGAQKKQSIHVDLVTREATTGEVGIVTPSNALHLPRLKSYPYRLYPVVDHIADKVCATIALYSGKPSSREKDLVDLVIIANTYDIDAVLLRNAIVNEIMRRDLNLPSAFTVPSSWGGGYKTLVQNLPDFDGYADIDDALHLMGDFLNPLLGRTPSNIVMEHLIWDHSTKHWVIGTDIHDQ